MIKTFRFDGNHEFSSNTYIVGDDEGNCVIIDIGSTNDKIIDYIKKNYKTCKAILLTHGHWDHIRGVNKILEWSPNTQVFIDELDEVMLTNSRLNCCIALDKYSGTINANAYLVSDGDEIKLSENLVFKVIETPFHTEGSVCYLFNKEKALFTGDSLFKGDIGRTDLPHNAIRKQKESLNKFKTLDTELIIYPGHGDESTLEKELRTNIYLE